MANFAFPKEFIRRFVASEKVDNASDDELLPFLNAFLCAGDSESVFDKCLREAPDDDTRRAIIVSRQTFRGLGALVSPQPGWNGSTLADVNYIIGLTIECTLTDAPDEPWQLKMSEDLGDVGRILSRHLAMDQAWVDRIEKFKSHTGADAMFREPVQALTREAADLKASLPKNTKDACTNDDLIASFDRVLELWNQQAKDLLRRNLIFLVTNVVSTGYVIP